MSAPKAPRTSFALSRSLKRRLDVFIQPIEVGLTRQRTGPLGKLKSKLEKEFLVVREELVKSDKLHDLNFVRDTEDYLAALDGRIAAAQLREQARNYLEPALVVLDKANRYVRVASAGRHLPTARPCHGVPRAHC